MGIQLSNFFFFENPLDGALALRPSEDPFSDSHKNSQISRDQNNSPPPPALGGKFFPPALGGKNCAPLKMDGTMFGLWRERERSFINFIAIGSPLLYIS